MPLSEDTIKLILDLGSSGKNVKEVREELDKLGSSSKNVGRGVLELSQAFQDLAQGGIGGVLNNIDGIVQKFGGPAGLAALISVTAVSAKLLYDNWGELAKLWSTDTSLETAIKQQEELEKRIKGSNDAIEKQIDALRKAETAGKPEAAAIARAAIQESGGVDVVRQQVQNALEGQSPEFQAATAGVNKAFNDNTAAAQDPTNPIAQLKALVAIRKAQNARNEARARIAAQAGGLVAGAGAGEQGAIGQLADLLPGSSFGQATPEGLAEQDAFVQDDLDQADRARRGGEARRRGRRRVSDLNRQGEANTRDINRTIEAESRERQARDRRSMREQEGERGGPLRTSPEQRARFAAIEAEQKQRQAAAQGELNSRLGPGYDQGIVGRAASGLAANVKKGADVEGAIQQAMQLVIGNQQELSRQNAEAFRKLQAQARKVRAETQQTTLDNR